MAKWAALLWLFVAAIGLATVAGAQEQASSPDTAAPIHGRSGSSIARTADRTSGAPGASDTAKGGVYEERAMRLEGEKRFQANCGRCHMPPHKFPPRAMATIVRHMRVRAMITDEDMRLILRYMTQ